MVGEVTLSITRSWVQNLSLPDERSNRETSRRIGFYSVYLVSLQGLPFTLLYLMFIVHASLINRSMSTSTLVVASRKRASNVSSANLFLALDFSHFITEKALSQM